MTLKSNSDLATSGLIAVDEMSIGKKLINHADKICQDKIVKQLFLTTPQQNEVAMKFYKKCEFGIYKIHYVIAC